MNRRTLIAAAVVGVIVGGAGISSATWTGKSTAGGLGGGKALVVQQVSGVSAADGTGSSVITWNAVSFGPGVTGYKVQRYSAATGATGQTAVCSAALTSTSNTCTDTVAAGTYFYGVSALYKPSGVSWIGAESTRDQAVVSAPPVLSGITVTGVTTAPTPALDCTGGNVGARTCTSANEGNSSGNVLTASIQLVDASGNAFTNTTGSSITIDLSKPSSGAGSDGTVSPSSLSVPNTSSTTSATFTATRQSGSNKTLTVTATIHGTTKTLTITLSS